MTINVLQAAKHLCKESGWALTNLELQKIIYLCHMEFLAKKNEPLVVGKFQAWDYGPVHPVLYHRLKRFGADSIPKSIFKNVKDLDFNEHKDEVFILNEGAESFPHPSGPTLIEITHREGGAWEKLYKHDVRDIEITGKYILEEYEDLKEKYLIT